MQTLLTTVNIHPRDSFRIWRDSICDRFGTFDISKCVDGPFSAELEGGYLGLTQVTRLFQRAVEYKLTADYAEKSDNGDYILACLMTEGSALIQQNGRDCVHKKGEIVLLDASPLTVKTSDLSKTVTFRIPRKKFEDVLGSVKVYSALSGSSQFPSMNLSSMFMGELLKKQAILGEKAAARMMAIGVDTMVAAFAERLATNISQPIYGTLVVQRAKYYMEENLHRFSLDPSEIAGAAGVSLRRLQELFHEQGQHILGWLWKRRLELAATRLADPTCDHLSIQNVAFSCGFNTQSHFSHRFKEHYGLPPRDYRKLRAVFV